MMVTNCNEALRSPNNKVLRFQSAWLRKLNLFMQEVEKMMTQPQPTTTPRLEEPRFGFTEYAERLNGRAAMIGFMLMVIIEYVTGQGVLAWLGLK